MDIKTLTPETLRKLIEAGHSQPRLRRARDNRKRAAELVFGQHYNEPEPGADAAAERGKRQPVNLGMQQFRTLLWNLAYSAGEPAFRAKFSELDSTAKVLTEMARIDMDRLDLTEVLTDGFVDNYLGGMAVLKCGLASGPLAFDAGQGLVDPGEFFVERVRLEDYSTDHKARSRRERRFDARRFRASKSTCIEKRLYGLDPEEREAERAQAAAEGVDASYLDNPHLATREEAEQILRDVKTVEAPDGAGEVAGDDDMIELWEAEVVCYGVRYTVVLPARQGDKAPQESVRFLHLSPTRCHENGTFVEYTFLPADDGLVPPSLEMIQRDMSIVADALMRKVLRAAIRSKRVAVADSTDAQFAKAAKDCEDGAMLTGSNVRVESVELGAGPEGPVRALEMATNVWNQQTNNSHMASGVDDAERTATAFAGLQAASNGWMQYLRKRTQGAAERIYTLWAWYKLSDPLMEVEVSLPVGDRRFPATITPELIEGRHVDFHYSVRDGTTGPRDPVMEAGQLVQFLSQALPALIAAVQTGVFKPEIIGETANQAGLRNIDKFLNDAKTIADRFALAAMGPTPMMGGRPMPKPGQGMGGAPGMPAATATRRGAVATAGGVPPGAMMGGM